MDQDLRAKATGQPYLKPDEGKCLHFYFISLTRIWACARCGANLDFPGTEMERQLPGRDRQRSIGIRIDRIEPAVPDPEGSRSHSPLQG
jgi:hypothetical protein